MSRFFHLALYLGILRCALPCLAATDEAGSSFEVKSGDHELIVRAQTADEAYEHLSRTLADMDFFRENGYDVALPDHPEFGAEAKALGAFDVFAAEVYEPADFETALDILRTDREKLRKALDGFVAAADVEGFRAFRRYEVRLTLYGPGGSFDPQTGTIVLLTTPDGRFKGGGGVHTIIHEMMHLAVDDGLVRRFGLSHWQKERLVDLLVQREFSALVPDYRLQSQGDAALDPYVNGTELKGLPTALDRFRSRLSETGNP